MTAATWGGEGGRISLIIPCHNAGAFIAAALDSALAQSHPPDEIVVIDDGSTDDSADQVRAFEGVRLVRQARSGISAARNRGLAEAEGDMIAFLDADDLWPAHSLKARLDVLLANPALGYVFGQMENFDDASGRIVTPPQAGRMAGCVLAWRQVFDEVGVFDTSLRTGEMIDWVARADAATCLAASVDVLVLRRRVHPTNTVRDTSGLHQDYLKLLRRNLERRRSVATA